jgi:predicted metal-dependent hydrolase
VVIARQRRARRYVLRLTPDGAVRLTVPRGASIAHGLTFAAQHASWIETEWARRCARGVWAHGTPVWYRGERVAVAWNGTAATLGGDTFPDLVPDGDLRTQLEARWRAMAAEELPGRCRALGAGHGLIPARITVRNQRSRWGSCSSRGAIALNWRLVQMPPAVADYVMLHELVHLEHPNHATSFWRRVAVVCPEWAVAERWLRAHGRDLL